MFAMELLLGARPCTMEDMNTYHQLETTLLASLANMQETDIVAKRYAGIAYNNHRAAHGFKFSPTGGTLLSLENEKLKKGEGKQLIMLALAPAASSLVADVCPHSTAGCRQFCVAYAGNGMYPAVQRARQSRTAFLLENPVEFVSALVHALDAQLKRNDDTAVRLNGFSDLRWEKILPEWFWARYNDVTFYDYTKHSVKSRPVASMPSNYVLTYSVTERSTLDQIVNEIDNGRSVAVVVTTKGGKPRGSKELRPLPFDGMVDGDMDDRRFNDPDGSVVALRRKGSLPVDGSLVVQDKMLKRVLAVVGA